MAKQNQALAKWDEELAKAAEAAAAQEAGVGGGQFFSLKGGTLSFNGSPIPNDEMAVVLIDSVNANVYYEDAYNGETTNTPTCYAFGRSDEEMAPHEQVEGKDQQSDKCVGCPQNEWGSAERGRGKACRNTRRIACIPAGTLSKDGSFEAFDDPDHFAKAAIGYIPLPPTSVPGFAQYVKQLYGALKKPPFAVFTKFALVEDEKTIFKGVFELIEKVPNELLPILLDRHKVEREVIAFPYAKVDRDTKPKGKARRPLKSNRKY